MGIAIHKLPSIIFRHLNNVSINDSITMHAWHWLPLDSDAGCCGAYETETIVRDADGAAGIDNILTIYKVILLWCYLIPLSSRL